MITILMDSNKGLHMSTKGVIHQKENLMDTLQFLVPATYDDIDLSGYIVHLVYLDKGNNVHYEELEAESELYNETYLVYKFTVDSELTNFAGDVDIRLSFKYQDNTLYSDTMTLNIKPLPSWYIFASTEPEEGDKDVIDVDEEVEDTEENTSDDDIVDVDDSNDTGVESDTDSEVINSDETITDDSSET